MLTCKQAIRLIRLARTRYSIRDFVRLRQMSGCYANVMGLPMCHVIRMLRKMKIQPDTEIFAGCETLLEYQCPVSKAISEL